MDVTYKYLFILYCFIVASLILAKASSTGSQYFSEESLISTNINKHLTAQYETKTGKNVFVFDGLVSYSHMVALRIFFSVNNDWRYVLFDKYVTDSSATFDHGNGIPWKSWQNPTVMSGTRFGHILESMVSFASQKTNNNSDSDDTRKFHLTEIYSAILRRGDTTQLHRDGNSTEKEGYSAVMYTNTIWRKNSYGELLFYEDGNDMDIFAVVSPRCGRVVVWDSDIQYITRPPSITELQGQYLIFAQFDSNPKLVFNKRTYFDRYLYELKASRKKRFVCTDNMEVPQLDLDKHLFLKRKSKAGDVVSVFDGLFNQSDLDALRTFTVKYGKYYYDDNLDLTSDNVQWIAGFNIKKLVQSRIWPIVHQVATYVSGKDTWYPYDVACNLIRSADHTRFHLDTSYDEEQEMTFLLYLNPNWTAANYGETAFMEKNYDSPDNDYVAEVVPRYGRAVIFDGNFPHSAHPPAPDYSGPRYTFVVKLSVNKLEAVEKAFKEEAQHSPSFAISVIKEIETNPDLFSRKQKISAVASYLQTKQVKQAIDQKPKTRENIDEARSSNNEDDDNLASLLGFESEITMSKEHWNLLQNMLSHHMIDAKKLEKHLAEVEKNIGKMKYSDTSFLFNQDQRINSWKKRCKKDADCLDDYFQLFLEQRSELSRRVNRDIIAVI